MCIKLCCIKFFHLFVDRVEKINLQSEEMISMNRYQNGPASTQIHLNLLSASFAFYVLFAGASSGDRIAVRLIVQGSFDAALARGAPESVEVVEIRGASVALLAGDTGLALAFPNAVALQASRTDHIAAASHAVVVLGSLIVILLAPLAIRSRSVRSTVSAVSASAGPLVQLLVEVTAVRVSVAFTS